MSLPLVTPRTVPHGHLCAHTQGTLPLLTQGAGWGSGCLTQALSPPGEQLKPNL